MQFETTKNQLLWKNIELISTRNNKKLLNGIAGSVGPCSMTALMGPSGAGKTTLLNALAARLPQDVKLYGEILLNGTRRDNSTWSRIMGYVEQEFNTYEYQTVYETMKFADSVKLNVGDEKVFEIMNILGLANVKDNYAINLSGGERKRLSIAVELLGNPPILFLDEPTSGLDSFNAINILELLKKLTEMGKTILVTIHQPSYQMVKYFEKIILLSQGGMVYEGSCDGCISFFEENGFVLPPRTNPTDFFLDTISMDTRTTESVQDSNAKISRIIKAWKRKNTQHPVLVEDPIRAVDYKGRSVIFGALFLRNITDYLRKKTYLLVKIFQKIIFILIFGLAYLRMGYFENDMFSRKGAYIFLVLNNLFGICAPIFNVFPQEKKTIIRERRSGMYSGYTAFLAKYVSEIPINLVYELLYVAILYWIIGLNSDAGRFFICLIIIGSLILFSIAFGLTISTVSPAANIAQIIGSTFILLFTVYSGAFNSTSTIPAWLRWMIYISPAYYAYTALLQNQLNGTAFIDNNGSVVTGEQVIAMNDSIIIETWWCILLIWLYTLGWIVVGCVALQIVTRNNIGLEKSKENVDENIKLN
ncbi:ABC transporter G family member 7 [Nosema granulosis]|uniref:ABC transporter G family member 7 n=1 Tax=Nosema granulosis TaxID=83296 RepID=A0A9P6GVK0_9MICR|nr:ABC transporter G family member 7 [Nosema granulosis]